MIDSRSIKDLRPTMALKAAKFLEVMKRRGVNVLITSTLRDHDMQEHLYSLGRTARSHVGPWTKLRPLGRPVTNAKAGSSPHNYGLAFDAYPIVGGKPVFDVKSPLWTPYAEAANEAGLEWFGLPGSPFFEKPHLQMANWRAFMASKNNV